MTHHLLFLDCLLPKTSLAPIAEKDKTTIIKTRVTRLSPNAIKSSDLAEFKAFVSAMYSAIPADTASIATMIITTGFFSLIYQSPISMERVRPSNCLQLHGWTKWFRYRDSKQIDVSVHQSERNINIPPMFTIQKPIIFPCSVGVNSALIILAMNIATIKNNTVDIYTISETYSPIGMIPIARIINASTKANSGFKFNAFFNRYKTILSQSPLTICSFRSLETKNNYPKIIHTECIKYIQTIRKSKRRAVACIRRQQLLFFIFLDNPSFFMSPYLTRFSVYLQCTLNKKSPTVTSKKSSAIFYKYFTGIKIIVAHDLNLSIYHYERCLFWYKYFTKSFLKAPFTYFSLLYYGIFKVSIHQNNRILSIEKSKNKKHFYINVLFIMLLKQFFNCLETLEYNGRKRMDTLTTVFSIYIYVNSHGEFITFMFMSFKKDRPSPVQQEYFQSPHRIPYKECNRYKKYQKSLDKFGLIIDQRMREHPLVWSNDSMIITAPSEQISVEANKTYSQDWTAYNQAQTQEKILLLEFLHNLTSQIPKKQQRRRGRPSIDIDDMIFCCCLKIYLDFSSRRSEGDVQLAYDLGYIENIPHFNTILNYLNKPELKTYLTQLIHLSALPLKDYEKTFTVDATGFSTSMHGRWLNIRACSKMEVVDIRKYMKCHIMSGAKTNVITHVEVTDHRVHDTVMFPDLVNTTGEFFDMQKVCADKGYMSRKNFGIVASQGAVPFIPFKSTSISRAGGVPIWHRMYCLFRDNYEEFKRHYHQRSNVESTFSMIKRKFGDHLRCKNHVACTNEILCKCLVHNITCLIQEMFTLGIKVEFEENAQRIFCAEREVY